MTAKHFVVATLFVAVVFVGIGVAGPWSHKTKCFGVCGPARRTPDAGAAPATCHPASFSLSEQHDREEGAGGHQFWVFKLTNISGARCDIADFPRVTFENVAGRTLPFHVRPGAGGMFIRAVERPTGVFVDPGHSVYFAFEKYRCDFHETDIATRARVRFFDTDSRPLTAEGLSLSYCREAASLDIAVSPFVSDLTYAFSH